MTAKERRRNWLESTGPVEVQVKLDLADSNLLRKLAHAEDRPMASIIRLAIRRWAKDANIEGATTAGE